MPTATIDRRQRQGIYEVVRNHFSSIAESIWLAMESEEDFPLAERISTEFVADTRLLADIGWAPEDERKWRPVQAVDGGFRFTEADEQA